MNVFQFFITCKRTNNANNATHYAKLGKKRRESSERNYYIISPRLIIKAIIINTRIIRSSALVQASFSLSMVRTRAWLRTSSSTKFYFHHVFRGLFVFPVLILQAVLIAPFFVGCFSSSRGIYHTSQTLKIFQKFERKSFLSSLFRISV